MSTFKGVVDEFPDIRIDYFRTIPHRRPPLACFLSHIHSDHLQGLESLKSPFIYCSPATRELLLRLEKYPHRMNFEHRVLECRKQHYKGLKAILKTIPLETPTEIELKLGKSIQVTLLDANHCAGAVMFLIEDERRAILYTGDIRSEPWWVNALIRNPVVVPYTTLGHRLLDKIYLDTTFAAQRNVLPAFPSKAEGLAELLRKVSKYPKDTVFHFHAWTPGYEEVWIALSNALGTRIHVDNHKMGLYKSLRRTQTFQCVDKNGKSMKEAKVESFLAREAAALCGHQCGNDDRPGCLTSNQKVRLHSCEAGTECEGIQSADVVWITPIITRSTDGADVLELGTGGGGGDLTQTHELDLDDPDVVLELLDLCLHGVEGTATRQRIIEIIKRLVHAPGSKVLLADLGIPPLDHEISLDDFADLLRRAADQEQNTAKGLVAPASGKRTAGRQQARRTIQFSYSRHSSYDELCHLVSVFKPRDIYPCTTDETSWCEEVSIRSLFGHLCSGDTFSHDLEMEQMKQERQAGRIGKQPLQEASSQNEPRTSSQASAATGESREENVTAKVDGAHIEKVAKLRRPDMLTPSPKRRRTDAGNFYAAEDASSHSANTTSNSTFSGHRRLNAMQRSFESYLAQPPASPKLAHSVSDPSPIPIKETAAPTTPIAKTDAMFRGKSTVRSPENPKGPHRTSSVTSPVSSTDRERRTFQTPSTTLAAKPLGEQRRSYQASSITPNPKSAETVRRPHREPPTTSQTKPPKKSNANNQPSGTQSRPLELSSDSDSDETTDAATDDERIPIKTHRKNITGFDGAQEERDTQLTLSDSAFESQEQGQEQADGSAGATRVQHRKAAYEAVRERNGARWDGLVSSSNGHGKEELEL